MNPKTKQPQSNSNKYKWLYCLALNLIGNEAYSQNYKTAVSAVPCIVAGVVHWFRESVTLLLVTSISDGCVLVALLV